MLSNLIKTVTAVALTPVAVVVDVVKLPGQVMNGEDGMMSTTREMTKVVETNIKEAVK